MNIQKLKEALPHFFIHNNCVVYIDKNSITIEPTGCFTCDSKYHNINFGGCVVEWFRVGKRWKVYKSRIHHGVIKGYWLHDCTNEKGVNGFEGRVWCHGANRQFVSFCDDVFTTKV